MSIVAAAVEWGGRLGSMLFEKDRFMQYGENSCSSERLILVEGNGLNLVGNGLNFQGDLPTA